MNEIEGGKFLALRTLVLSGVLATIFYLSHVIGGRMVWSDYNPLIQPISDLTAASSISQPVASRILWGYNVFNLLFCGILLVFFKRFFPINKIFYSGLVLKALAELLSTFGYKIFPLADTTWGNSFQNTMHYAITAVIVFSYIVLSILLALGLAKTKTYPKMTRFLKRFSIIFIVSGFFTILATQVLPSYVGLIERINLYSLMILNVVLALWMRSLLSPLALESE
ncbi:Protein of unknown function [Proteiniborus ethanoligenes]|uniref:DUF998 domain-containing protein n=1 Tax=Proteiniborus ethanoligenes TaxID=415015 RepID=A0A1H3NV77_9FIRM|nr:DUF998 domain-containing protein [Proteiniborus ethanoligenes]SDY92718.1 Protein of unknown function [Proteiniborus ethanoligenes]